MKAVAFADVCPEKQAEVIQISDFQQNEFITVICDLGNFNGTATELLTLIKAMSSAPSITRLKPEGLTKLLHKRKDILQLKGMNITIGKSGHRFIILQKTVQTVPNPENIEPVAHEPQTEFIWFQYFCKSGDLFTAYRHWAEQSNCIPNKQVPLAWCYAYKNWSWHDRKKLSIRKTEASPAISRSELQKQRFEQAREEKWQCREKLMEKIDKMINQPIPRNWKIKDLVAIIKMINDIDRYLFGYEFRELEAIAILYRSGMLTDEQMTQIDQQFQILKENIRAIFSDLIH
jgi:hypothetical protein